MARQGYGRHNVIATGPNETGKQISVNVWNEDVKDYGLLGFTSKEYTIDGSGVVDIDTTATDNEGQSSVLIVESAGGSSVDDDLDQITTAMTNPYDLLYVFAKGIGNTITVRDNTGSGAGKIQVLSTTTLSTTVPLILIRVGTAGGATAGDDWIQYGGGGSVSANDLTGTVLKSTVVTSSLTDVGALDEGSITSGFGTIDTGTDAISTTGTVTTGGLTIGGDIGTAAAQDWDLIDNTADALSFDSTGKAGILKFVTTDDGEGVTMSGTLGVTGAITGTLTGNASGLSATLAVGSGGTGSTTTSAARTALGVAIGSDVQAYSANTALTTDKLSDFAATSSSELAGTINDETGSGLLVFGTGPTITLANGTGLVATTGLTATGTKDGTTFLRGDDTWASAGGGAVELGEYKYQANGYTTPSYTTRTVNDSSTPVELWVKDIDASGENQGVFIRIKKNDAYEDVQLG